MTEITDEIINYVFNRKIPPKSFRSPAKARDICKMRAKGYTYTDIGKTFNLSPSRVRVYVERTMRVYRAYKSRECGFSYVADKVLSVEQNWTEEQAIHDLEKVILRGERPADKVVGMAIKALQKQIPKKAEKRGYFYCGHCGDIVTPIMDYCRHCGQKIDWSDLK